VLGEVDVIVGDPVADDAVDDVAGELVSAASSVPAATAWDVVVEPAARLVSLAHDVRNTAVAASNT
jgi:hypothetical protein